MKLVAFCFWANLAVWAVLKSSYEASQMFSFDYTVCRKTKCLRGLVRGLSLGFSKRFEGKIG